jgi:hypothetical protein
MTSQLNVRIAKRLKRQVGVEQATIGVPVTNEIITEVALEHLFTSLTREQRAKFYRNHNRKPYAGVK